MVERSFPVPIDQRYFEDYVVGTTYEFDDTVTVREKDIVAFAEEFDPQSFHVDPDSAVHGQFGGLIASGWHTTAVMMRLLARHYLSSVASLASPGVDELRWVAPVRPGDALRLRATVVESRRSRTKPDRGIVRTAIELLNQRDEVVLRLTAMNLLAARSVLPEGTDGSPGPSA
ncbi:MaoC family dehydratase [Spiractinospora alimapuensis]|uniref:MaoC family dehydratase n=1 Tax=Spiractinospora alimapuensis TaxID=2820884 RepID=UPI001F3F72AE|nr:MaoC family dehydratase [Spiractinospora alimapuensis]QVQ51105.1 MaoC family dehydratase [Spiractinospora alimapuensis]